MGTSIIPGPKEKVHLSVVLTKEAQLNLPSGISGPLALSQPLTVMCIFTFRQLTCHFFFSHNKLQICKHSYLGSCHPSSATEPCLTATGSMHVLTQAEANSIYERTLPKGRKNELHCPRGREDNWKKSSTAPKTFISLASVLRVCF